MLDWLKEELNEPLWERFVFLNVCDLFYILFIILQISSFIEDVYTKTDAFLLIQLNYERIKLLRLEVDAESIRYRFVYQRQSG